LTRARAAAEAVSAAYPVIFKQVDTTTEQVAATAASVMESVPTIP
jgi:hypothetical protein